MPLEILHLKHVGPRDPKRSHGRIESFLKHFPHPNVIARAEQAVIAAISSHHMYMVENEQEEIIFLTGCYEWGAPPCLELGTTIGRPDYLGFGIQRHVYQQVLTFEWLMNQSRLPIIAVIDRDARASLINSERAGLTHSPAQLPLLKERAPDRDWSGVESGRKRLYAVNLAGLISAIEYVAQHHAGIDLVRRDGQEVKLCTDFQYLTEDDVAQQLQMEADLLRRYAARESAR